MANATNGLNFDGSSVRLRLSRSALGGIVKLSLPEITLKEEKIVLLGDQSVSVRTPGIMEIGDGALTITQVGWKAWLAVLPDEWMNVEFQVTGNQRHATIRGSYGTILDRCRMTKKKPSEWANDEKNATQEITLSCMSVIERGDDGKWKRAARRPGADPKDSPAAQALMF